MMAPSAFPIAGIGASAGGVEALQGFFRGLPKAPGMSFVVVTHLSPERKSYLHEIVARHTGLPVHVATDDMMVERDNVYILPADAVLTIAGGQLAVHRSAARPGRKPIDVFFSALAVDQGEMAVGIVLSGGDGDGTLGIRAIKERGGLTLAQVADGYGPRHPDMPDSAIATGLVDFALPVEEMGARLAEFARSVDLLVGLAGPDIADANEPGIAETPAAQALYAARGEIYDILRDQVGHDFSGYKTRTFLRRVQRRMQVGQLGTIEAYIEHLRQDQREVRALFRDLLINVTNFFRDAKAFDYLARDVVPQLFAGRGPRETVRVWIPGCATGEEVYSIAMLLREHMDTLSHMPTVQIFASDIDEHALGVARAGRYPQSLMDTVSPERRRRFFLQDGESYLIAKEIRDLCIFSPHSVIRDPPFSRIDLVSCRNLMIYFGPEVQNQVIPIFHYALRRDGYLFLGASENISQFEDLFAVVEKGQRIYRRRPEAGTVRLPSLIGGIRSGSAGQLPARGALGGVALRQAVENQVLEQFAPPYVVVNAEGEVAYYSSRTGKYLEAAPGAPSRHILTLARKGLRLDLHSALQQALQTGRAITRESVAVEADGGFVQVITLTVLPLQNHNAGELLFLVMFIDDGPARTRDTAALPPDAIDDDIIPTLERDLRETRERLQSVIEEYETALEELKVSNEELLSVNEEAQSSNEELEASKEELQSVNEELHTVNAELNDKVEKLDRANSDLKNLFESTDVATIFLDASLTIRSFTPAVVKVFNILPTDCGRPITDFSRRLKLADFDRDIVAVLAGESPIDRRATHALDDTQYLVRLAPYRDDAHTISGVVASFVDITALTEAERRQRVLIAELQHRTRNLLTVVQSIAMQTVGKGRPAEAFSTRLAALGRAQGLISLSGTDEVDLAEIVRVELQAHVSGDGDNVTAAGPPVTLHIENAQLFALALHELATNAVKHGALSGGRGQLDIRWSVIQEPPAERRLVLVWRESGVAMPADQGRRGYGRELLERALTFTLQATSDLVFGPDGVSCRIEMPLPTPSDPPPARDRDI